MNLFFSPRGGRSVDHIQLLQKLSPSLRSILPVCRQIHCLEEHGCHGRSWSENRKEVSQVGRANPAVHFEFQGSDLELISSPWGVSIVDQSSGVSVCCDLLCWSDELLCIAMLHIFFKIYNFTPRSELKWSKHDTVHNFFRPVHSPKVFCDFFS